MLAARATRRSDCRFLPLSGNTNINAALLEALSVVGDAVALRKEAQPLVFFLTDGHPTVGETDSGVILGNVKKANEECEAAIFSLAFGRLADFQMLKLLSLQNNAFARKIYVAADASLQLEGFYKEVSSVKHLLDKRIWRKGERERERERQSV